MTSTLRIAEVARRSGFAAPTLRYYEQLGLLPPPRRTPSGYRAYDESVLARLALIGRAKALGCSLEEIATLMPHWEHGSCAPVQERLRALAAAKLVQAQSRVDELSSFGEELHRIVDELGSRTPPGPCDAGCGCLGDAASPTTAVPARSVPPAPVAEALAPRPPGVACTLPGDDVPGRIRDWERLLAHATRRTAVDGGLRLELDAATPVGELARLLEAERSCCRFFAFTLTFDERGVALEVRAPQAAQRVVDELFGRA